MKLHVRYELVTYVDDISINMPIAFVACCQRERMCVCVSEWLSTLHLVVGAYTDLVKKTQRERERE